MSQAIRRVMTVVLPVPPGDDQERSGIVGDGPALLVVQAVEDALTRHAVSTINRRTEAGGTSTTDVGAAGQTSATSVR